MSTIARTNPNNSPQQSPCDWRCSACFKLLGKRSGERIHVCTTNGHAYLASLPVTAVCRCGTLNEMPFPTVN